MRRFIPIICMLLFWSCGQQLQVSNYQAQRVRLLADTLEAENAQAKALIAPYKNKLDSQMNIRIMVAEGDFKKDYPEGTLGNMVCDLLMTYAQSQKMPADFCVLNNGGLRIPTLYKGDITVRTVFELMPFENSLVMVKVSGANCAKLFAMIAENDGAPVSGMRMEIVEGKATQITVQNQMFDTSKDYWILTSDYIANGGDKADALKNPIERRDYPILLRDILMIEMKKKFYDGETLVPVKDGRITKK
jgi:2',3'-cyclic-nucleotide 2'-phosphodiesterase (5'-nucleotidase family)